MKQIMHYILLKEKKMSFIFNFFSLRNNNILGGDLHPPHQQCLESHPVHTDHQFLQRAGGTFVVPLAETAKAQTGPQEPHQLCYLHRPIKVFFLPSQLHPTDIYFRHRWQVQMKMFYITDTAFVCSGSTEFSECRGTETRCPGRTSLMVNRHNHGLNSDATMKTYIRLCI